ncbi:hypothetical protein RHS04_07674 [Rhizoctonia solani]|uniref:DUF2235 domain-containing protein n=1 Tax=Rhizoctonia solani TaxID=456999 RepID=A0A8H7LEU1_9AGAM|nr:hypothetical protein RHS04_07674 [Rhizoctonia solani]
MSPPTKSFTLELRSRGSLPGLFVRVKEYNIAAGGDEHPDTFFNLSTAVGSDNGSLRWGGSAFEKTARDIKIFRDEGIQAWILQAKVMNPAGNINTSRLNLDDYLDVIQCSDPGTTNERLAIVLKPRTLVLCFDGTSKHFSNHNTSVVNFMELLNKNDPSKQATGVGTYGGSGFLNRIGLRLAARVDEATAWYLYQHVIDGYKFLMETYQTGDQINIFGYSRGAYTARALAGMIHQLLMCKKIGLLPKSNHEHVAFAYDIYKSSTESIFSKLLTSYDKDRSLPENVDPAKFKKVFCRDVKIHFVGVWDTVGSVGSFWRRRLPHVAYNPSIRFFRQALALDEKRGNFIPSLWDHRLTNKSQDVLEVWFKGDHADVGGGKKINDEGLGAQEKPVLSNIPFRWMLRECQEHTRVRFDREAMNDYRETLGANYPRQPGEGQNKSIDHKLDCKDVQGPYNALARSVFWSLLEWLPVPKLAQRGARPWLRTVYWPNAHAPRIINFLSSRSSVRLHYSRKDGKERKA